MAPSDQPRNPGPPETGPKKRGRKDKGSAALWTFVVAMLLVVTLLSWIAKQGRWTTIPLSEFQTGLENKTYTAANVHQGTFTPTAFTFQDQPAKVDPEDAAGTPLPTTTQPLGSAKQFRVPLGGIADESRAELLRALQRKEIPYRGSPPDTEWQQYLPLLLMVALVIGIIFAFRKMGGPGAAMSFGRSRGRLFADDDVKATFDDVAGIDEAVEELREIVEFLKTPGKYQALGGRIPRGVLLVGPPGTGKTLLAKAVAGEAGVPFFSLSGSDFVEMYVGVGAARVRDMFSQAVQRSPSIIFIDELDALGKVRGGATGGHDEREQTLNALLVEMDGFSSDQSVIVMGATNRPETLDPALLRPGRFDRHVLVDRPDYKGRAAILKVHGSKIKLEDGVDLTRIAKLTPGMVGADLANTVNEAALLAARAGKSFVSNRELEEAIERVIAGLEKSSRVIHQDEKQRVAFHESGHALVACSLPHTDPVHKISIIPRGMGALGYMMQRPEDDRHLVTQSELQNRICVMLGGIAAEELVFQEISTGAQNDLERGTEIARRMVMEFGMSPRMGRVNYRESKRSLFLAGASTGGADYAHSESTLREIDLEVKRIIDDCMETARDTLKRRRPVLEQIARELIEIEVMDAEMLHRILDAHKTGPQIKPGTFVDRPAEDTPPISSHTERRDAVEGA